MSLFLGVYYFVIVLITLIVLSTIYSLLLSDDVSSIVETPSVETPSVETQPIQTQLIVEFGLIHSFFAFFEFRFVNQILLKFELD